MGSKSTSKAKSTKNTANSGGTGTGEEGAEETPVTGGQSPSISATSVSCPLIKHFFKVKVVDSEGNPVTTITPTIELNDGTTVTPGLDGQGVYDSTKILTADTECYVSFPNLYNAEWWPDGPPPDKFTMKQDITIADGDCVVKIAKDNGYRDYQTIWKRSKNKTLRNDHPNPTSLVVGDVLKTPSSKDKRVPKAVDQEWKFVITVEKPGKLSIILLDKKQKPLNGWDYSLSIPPLTKAGKTGADGLIEVPNLDVTKTSGTLKVTIPPVPVPPTSPPVVPPVTDPPAYPPAIVVADFKDKAPDRPVDSDKIEWTLKIGSLPSHKVKTGVLGRLQNLGCNCAPDSDDAKLTAAVKLYQKAVLSDDAPSGAFADIQDDLEDRHSKK